MNAFNLEICYNVRRGADMKTKSNTRFKSPQKANNIYTTKEKGGREGWGNGGLVFV